MYEELYAPVPDTDAFLNRLGVAERNIEPNLENLDMLIKAFVSHVPFENLTVAYFHHVPSLGIQDLFNKMILHRRGGYCHEKNGLFLSFLKTLGFEAYSVSAYVREDLDFLSDLGHRSNICVIDGRKYFLDVGYGGSAPTCAVPLSGEVRGGYFLKYLNNEYHVYKVVDATSSDTDPFVKSEILNGEMVYCKETVMFRDFVAYPVEFVLANKGIALDPENRFYENIIMNYCNPEGEVFSLVNDDFKYKTSSGKGSIKIQDDQEFRDILEKYFNIEMYDEFA